jgi:Predicted membrane protein
MKNISILLTYLLSLLPVIVFTALTPYFTRRSESFGISIPEESYNDPAIQKIRTLYRRQGLWSGFIITVVLLALALNTTFKTGSSIMGAGIILQLLIMFGFYLQGHRAMRVLKAGRNWEIAKSQVVVIDTDFRKKKMLVSPWWFGIDFLLIAITIILSFTFYDRLPEKIPIHFNIIGQADNWMAKSFFSVFFAPAMQLLMTLLMFFVYAMIGKARQQAEAVHPEQSLEQNRIFRYRWSVFIVFTSLAMNGLFGMILFTGFISHIIMSILFLGIMASVMIWVVILCFTTGQGGSLLKLGRTKSERAGNRDEDRHWKLGIFYYNPDDPALFVEKRFGIGWTFNFGRPSAWIWIIGLIIFIILITQIKAILKR